MSENSAAPPKRGLIVGLGNPVLGDDGVGWHVARHLEQDLARNNFLAGWEVEYLALGGLSLMERLIGYEWVILIDAIVTGQRPLGSLHILEDLPEYGLGHSGSIHDTTLQAALSLGCRLGASLPKQIRIVGVEAQQLFDFSEELTPPVAAAVPQAAEVVMGLLRQFAKEE